MLFGYDCLTPSEAALLPPTPLDPMTVINYRENVLSTVRELAANSIKKVQAKYKRIYDQKSTTYSVKVGDWVLLPQEEVGKLRKLSRPWDGPYRVVSRVDPDITATKVYYSDDNPIRVHLSRVTPCPN